MPDLESTEPVLEQQVPVEDLCQLGNPMARALGEAGVGGARIHELLGQAVRAECVGCGITVSGEELGHLTVAGGSPTTDGGRLERLRLGYCARPGCTSKFYTLRLKPAAGVDWMKILARTRELIAFPASADLGADEAAPIKPMSLAGLKLWWRNLETRRRLQLFVFAGVVALFFVVRWYQSGARIPLISPKAREFIVAPDAGDAVMPVRPAKGTPTNAPRSFIVR